MENKRLEEDKIDAQADLDGYTGTDDAIKKSFSDKVDSITKSITDNEEDIKTVETHITVLKEVLDKLDLSGDFIVDKNKDDVAAGKDDAQIETPVKDFYDNNYKSSDYPEVYKSLSKITEEKDAIVQDAYKNFYPQFTTRAEGDAEWPTELAASYGGAATFDQAIDYLVTQEISSKAFNSYKFEINKSFTVEQNLWAKYISTSSPFEFLKNSVQSSDLKTQIDEIGTDKDTIEKNILAINKGEPINGKDIKPSTLSSNVLFLGSTSPDHRISSEAYDHLGNVVKYQHLLIKATQGKTQEELWTITGDDLKKLMEFVQYTPVKDDASQAKRVQGATLLSDTNLFNDADTEFTDFVLGAISGNSAGTLKTQGSLGIKSEIEYLKAMVSGFSLGALSITEGTGTPITDATKIPTIDLEALTTNLQTALQKEVDKDFGGIDVSTSPSAKDLDTVNNDIDSTITSLGDEKVKTIFGKVLEDFFKDKTELVYQVKGAPGHYLVISQFGIHIIKRTGYSNHEIEDQLNADLDDMANDSSLSSSTSIAAELNNYYSETKIMETLIHKEHSTDVDTPYITALKTKLDEYSKGKDEVDKVTFEEVTEVINSVDNLADQTAVDDAIGDKLENWLVTQLDSGMRTIGTKELSDIYDWVKLAQAGRDVK